MRTNSSPTLEAARLLAARENLPSYEVIPPSPTSTSQSGPSDERWCEWPRRPASKPPFTSIRQALQTIQAIQQRHA